MWFADSDCHPARARTRFMFRCNRCRAELCGTLPGYPTERAMRRAAAAQGWQYVTVAGPGGKQAGNDHCPACAKQTGQRSPGAMRPQVP